MKKLFLVDAYALIFRSYYAFISRPMRNGAGLNTSAIFGFTKFLRDIIKREKPDYLGVAFDPKGGNFRNEIYPLYKANRSETPEDIKASVPHIKRILEAMKIPILEVANYEADDVIGTLSTKAALEEFDVYMVTPDKDFGQLIQPSVKIYKQRKGGEGVDIVGMEQIKEQYGIDDPKLIIDILALWGDASDNIPGVPGIGEKGATKLVNQFGTVENLLENLDKVSGKQQENLRANADQLRLAKTLATIDLNVPIAFNPHTLVMEEPDYDALRDIFSELGFQMFLREFAAEQNAQNEPASQNNPQTVNQNKPKSPLKPSGAVQGDLFGAVQGSLFDDTEANTTTHTDTSEGSDLFGTTTAGGYQTVHTTPHKYTLVDSIDELRSLAEMLGKSPEVCFDTETTGLDTFNDRIVGVSFSVKEFEAYYVPLTTENCAERLELLRPVFEDEAIVKIGQNIKFDIMVLKNAGVDVRGFKADTMILHYLLNPESRHNMDFMARSYLGYSPIEIESLIGRGARQLTMDMIQMDRVLEYAAEDADVTMRLYNVLWNMVRAQGLETLYRNIEEPLIGVLADIEMTGVKIDSQILSDYGKRLTVEITELETKIREIAGDPTLNVNSTKQMGDVLFLRLKIDDKPKMTKGKQYRTDEEYLQQLSDRHPVVGMVLEYRGMRKLLTTYIDALPQLVNKKTGRIHTSFNQAVTSTGRLSSTNPNLQNIPIRDQQGREIRKAFVASNNDYELLSVDYSQVELRLMAHLSGDEALIEAFRNGEDIHTATAARVFNIAKSEVTSDHRRKAKTANFGIIYGISVFGLSQRLNISRPEAKEIIDGYFASYQGVRNYMEEVVEKAREDGYVSTIFGRKRFLADIRSGNAVVRGLAERNAINAPIQGSAADIMKLAMIAVHAELTKHKLKSKITLQVHDELVIDMLRTEKEQVVGIVVQAMEHAAELSVPLTVDYGIGENWIDAH